MSGYPIMKNFTRIPNLFKPLMLSLKKELMEQFRWLFSHLLNKHHPETPSLTLPWLRLFLQPMKTFPSMDLPLMVIRFTRIRLMAIFLWDVPGSHMCDPGCQCLEEEDDDDFNRQPRHRKKKSHRMEPCQQRPPLPPDDPDNTTPLSIYKKGLRLIR